MAGWLQQISSPLGSLSGLDTDRCDAVLIASNENFSSGLIPPKRHPMVMYVTVQQNCPARQYRLMTKLWKCPFREWQHAVTSEAHPIRPKTPS
jgi:hypothetical protein